MKDFFELLYQWLRAGIAIAFDIGLISIFIDWLKRENDYE